MKRKRSSKSISSVVQARAGLIPESDWTAAEVRERKNRTECINRTIRSYVGLSTKSSDAAVIPEILADLRHYCDCRGLAFEELDRVATETYENEAYQTCMLSPLVR
jgi:hypothetical protein